MGFHPSGGGSASNPDERRSAARYDAKGIRAEVAWLVGTDLRAEPVSLQDISVGGALAVAKTAPAPGTFVTIHLVGVGVGVGTGAGVEIPARVVRVVKGRPRGLSIFRRKPVQEMYRLSLAFEGSCPYDLFKAAVDGFVVESQAPSTECEGFEARDWR